MSAATSCLRAAAPLLTAAALAGILLFPARAVSQEEAASSGNTAHANAPEPLSAIKEPVPTVRLTPEQEARARVLEGVLRCPVCRSQSIRQSRSFMADDMRQKTRAMIAEGRSDDEIREYFIERYGTWVLLTPPKRGFNLAAYLLPVLVVVIGAAGLTLAGLRWKRASAAVERSEPPPPSRHLTRLERELEEIE